jgi:UDP-glucose 4-epimerase
MLSHGSADSVKPTRVLVLGAAGFLAQRLAHHFQGRPIECRPVGSREVDLTERYAVEKLRGIIRAGDSMVVTSALTPEHGRDRTTFLKNVSMVENLCAVAAEMAQVVYVGSDSVYDVRCECVSEDSRCEPADLYGLSHLVRERLLRDACPGERLAIIRPCAIYGAGDTHNSYGPNRFLRSALADGKITLFGQGEERRDHVYVDDVCRIILACLLHRSAGVLNAVSGTAVTFAELARSVVDAVGRHVEIETAPRRVAVTHRWFDTAALRSAFPDFRATSLETGIRETIAAMVAG